MSAGSCLRTLKITEAQPRGDERLPQPVRDYEPGNVSDRVVRIILSYTDFVNQRVCTKSKGLYEDVAISSELPSGSSNSTRPGAAMRPGATVASGRSPAVPASLCS
jgi:hypothetical protein